MIMHSTSVSSSNHNNNNHNQRLTRASVVVCTDLLKDDSAAADQSFFRYHDSEISNSLNSSGNSRSSVDGAVISPSTSNTNQPANKISRLSDVIFWRLNRNSGKAGKECKKSYCKTYYNNSTGEAAADDCHPTKKRLHFSLDQLLQTVWNKSDETALSPDDECITCVTRRACIQSYPCGHRVLCEKCFIKLLQINYSEGKYPITCVFCRSPVALFKRHEQPSSVTIKKGSKTPGTEPRSQLSSLHVSHLPRTSIKRPAYL